VIAAGSNLKLWHVPSIPSPFFVRSFCWFISPFVYSSFPCWAHAWKVPQFHPAPGLMAMAVAPAARGINLPATQGSSNSGGFIPGWTPVNGQFFEE